MEEGTALRYFLDERIGSSSARQSAGKRLAPTSNRNISRAGTGRSLRPWGCEAEAHKKPACNGRNAAMVGNLLTLCTEMGPIGTEASTPLSQIHCVTTFVKDPTGTKLGPEIPRLSPWKQISL